jgi:hypothetical protein
LARLELGDNPALLPGLTGCRALAAAFVHPRGARQLRRVGFANCGLKPDGVGAFAAALAPAFAVPSGESPAPAGWPLAWLDLGRNPSLTSDAAGPAWAALAAAVAATTDAMLQGGEPEVPGDAAEVPRPWRQWGLASAGAAAGAAAERFCFGSLTVPSFDLSPSLVGASHCPIEAAGHSFLC